MVEPQGGYPGTVWYRPSIPGILGYQDTGYMVDHRGNIPGLSVSSEYPGYPRIPRHRVYGGDTGGISRDCLVSSEYPGYPRIPRHRVYGGATGGISRDCLVSSEYLGYPSPTKTQGIWWRHRGGYPGTVWYRPSILYHTLGYQDTWREIPGQSGTVLVSRVYVVPKRREIEPRHSGKYKDSPRVHWTRMRLCRCGRP